MHIKDFDPYDFKKTIVSDVPVYYKNLPWAPCINVRIVFNVGGRVDPLGKECLSHFLEHIIFNGSPLLPTKKDIKAWGKINTLNSFNAWTGHYNTAYTLRCLPEKYPEVLNGLFDTVFNSFIKEENVEEERKIITQESWSRYKNEKYLKYVKDYLGILYPQNHHARLASPLGWQDTIQSISQADIKNWHVENYTKGNFFIVLTGAVEESHIQELEKHLKGLKISKGTLNRDSFLDPSLYPISVPTVLKSIRNADDIGESKEQVEISYIRVGAPFNLEETEIGNVFRRMLHDILFERMRLEHSLCYSIGINFNPNKTYSFFAIEIKTDEKNIELVDIELKKITEEIQTNIHKDRFLSMKQIYTDQMKSTELLSEGITNDTVEEIAQYDGRIITQKKQIECIEQVIYEDVQKLSRWAFDPLYLHTEIILPSKKD
ncbi:pitrilysin family protein [soil metagenome]